jgi:inositol phosphorylceramide mannosyltransferase catalytic subunit
MRPRIYLPLIFLLVLIIYFVVRLLGFLQIFFEHTGIRITQDEAKAAYLAQTPDTRKQFIPKKIHQVYHDWSGNNTSIPADWDEVRHTCINLNPDWEYTVRDDLFPEMRILPRVWQELNLMLIWCE